MQHLEGSIHVDAPVEHVWTFFFDTSHWSDWQPRGEYSDFTGPMDQVGTTYVGSTRFMGHEFKSTYKILEVIPNELYHEWGEMGPNETYIRFVPEGDGTRITYESDFEMPGHMPKVLQDIMNRHWMERQHQQMLENFKVLAEATAPVHA